MEISNLYSAYDKFCTESGDHVLFHLKDKDITFTETLRMVKERAAFLQKNGFGKNDIIGILSANSPDWCITFMAVTSIGAYALPMDTNLNAERYEEMVKEVKAKAVFISDSFSKMIKSSATYDISLSANMGKEKDFKPVDIDMDHIASLLFTSGTTGKPKVVMLTHKNFITCSMEIDKFEEHYEEVQLAILPLFHVYAFVATFLAPLFSKSTIVFQNSLKGPDIIQSLQENDITVFPAAPLMWELFFDSLASKLKAESQFKYNFFMFFVNNAPVLNKIGLGFLVRKIFTPVHDVFGHSHHFFISGGAPLKKEYFTYFKNMGFNIMEGYGLSETTGPIAIPYHKNAKAGCVGPPVKGNEVKVENINEDGIGEICLRGDAVSPGYYKNDEANKQAYDEEGFFHTGDLGRVNENGHIYITGRMKNVIVLDSGKNVYPEELEFYYKESPEIAEIAVISRQIEGRATLFAVIVPAHKNDQSYGIIKQELAALNRNLPAYRRVYNFAVSFDPLPKNSTRKVLYREVINELEKGIYQTDENDTAVLQNILTGNDPAEQEAVEALKSRFKKETLYESQTLSDFNIDSLGFVDLCVYLEEKLGVSIDVEELKRRETLGEMVAFLSTLEKAEGQSSDDRILRSEIEVKPFRFFNPFNHFVLFCFKTVCRACWKLKVINGEKINYDGNIFIANHSSYLDVIWVSAAIDWRFRKHVYVTGKKKFFFLRYLFPMFPMLPIEEGKTIETLKVNADILRQGKNLIIFPEGGRSDDGEIKPFMSGAAYLARNLDRKIIPFTIKGAYEVWPRQRKLPRFITSRKGAVLVGDAIDPSKFKSTDDLTRHMEEVIKKEYKEQTV